MGLTTAGLVGLEAVGMATGVSTSQWVCSGLEFKVGTRDVRKNRGVHEKWEELIHTSDYRGDRAHVPLLDPVSARSLDNAFRRATKLPPSE